MDSEDELMRPPPLRPYMLVQARLDLPQSALQATLALLQRAGARESGLFWYGPKDSVGNGQVSYVVAPRQTMTWGNYHVPAEALSEIVRGLDDGWSPLAQVHSHPGPRVEHSLYDDRMVSTRRALSLVFPSYGRSRESFPTGVGVHEFQNDYWYLLETADAARRVVLCAGNVKVDDFR